MADSHVDFNGPKQQCPNHWEIQASKLDESSATKFPKLSNEEQDISDI